MQRRDLRAMNSDIELVACLPRAGHRLDLAERWLVAFENRYSRFRVISELTRLNETAGRPFKASLGFFRLVQLSLDFASRSGGLFDPTILHSLEAAGYDRSFELIEPAAWRGRRQPKHSSWRDVALDLQARTISLPAGTGIDLGGVGKGWAVDRLATILGSPCLVNGGGDVFLAGTPTGEPGWRVGVADPFQPDVDRAMLTLRDRGIGTSSVLKRRWKAGGAVYHHIIDPRTGTPSASDAVQVTAVASSTVEADFHAKVALLLGAEAGLEYLDREPDVDGLIVRRDGARLQTGGLAAYL